MCFFFFLFGPVLLSKLLTFSFLVHLKQCKMLCKCHLQFYKSALNSNSNRATYKEFFEWSSFLVFGDLFFFEFLTPSTLGGCNFLNSNPFLMISNAPDASIGGVQVLFGLQKQWSPPLGSGLPWALKWSLMGCSTLVGMRGNESNNFLWKKLSARR